MTIGIIGSSELNNYNEIETQLNKKKFEIDKIVCGGKRGTEKLAEQYANKNKISIEICYPNWSDFGTIKFSDNINTVIEKSDMIYCFYNDSEPEKSEIIKRIQNLNKKYRLFTYKS